MLMNGQVKVGAANARGVTPRRDERAGAEEKALKPKQRDLSRTGRKEEEEELDIAAEEAEKYKKGK